MCFSKKNSEIPLPAKCDLCWKSDCRVCS